MWGFFDAELISKKNFFENWCQKCHRYWSNSRVQSVLKNSLIVVIVILGDDYCLIGGKDFWFLDLVSFPGIVLSYGGGNCVIFGLWGGCVCAEWKTFWIYFGYIMCPFCPRFSFSENQGQNGHCFFWKIFLIWKLSCYSIHASSSKKQTILISVFQEKHWLLFFTMLYLFCPLKSIVSDILGKKNTETCFSNHQVSFDLNC